MKKALIIKLIALAVVFMFFTSISFAAEKLVKPPEGGNFEPIAVDFVFR